MNGGLTHQELELWKRKARNLDAALAYLNGRINSEEMMHVERILREGIEEPLCH